jgi:hypothetical protein
MGDQFQGKTAVSVSDMARQCGLSRSRFYQLVVGGTFPPPLYDVATKRPFYTEELQQVCLEVRRRNCGIDGKPVLFYARRIGVPVKKTRKVKPAVARDDAHLDILDGLRSLGITTATMPQVTTAVKELFPEGVTEMDRGEVLRAVFLHLKRQNQADNVR